MDNRTALTTGILIGVVIGVVVVLLIGGLIIWMRKRNAEWDNPRQQSSSGSSRRSSANHDEEPYQAPDPQEDLYVELSDKYDNASTKEEYTALQNEVKSNQSKLAPERYDSLLADIQSELDSLAEEERIQAEKDAKFAKFRALRNNPDKDAVFSELHKIMTLEEDDPDAIISYYDLENADDSADIDWLNSTYDELLKERLRTMLLGAVEGTVADYEAVRALEKELIEADWTDSEGNSIGEFISTHLSSEWNEMIVRYIREPDWYDNLYGLDDLDDDDWKVIFKKARDEQDLLSVVIALLKDDNDNTFSEFLAEEKIEEIKTELDATHLALGFKSGQEERSI